jgi:hypothetical protein
MAAKYGYSEIVVTLLEKGAYVNIANKVTLILWLNPSLVFLFKILERRWNSNHCSQKWS